MNAPRPLFWSQGLQLHPQHFQLLERSYQGLLTPYQAYLQPHMWGVARMNLQKSALGTQVFSILDGEFLFPDGTFASLPDNACVETRRFDEAWVEAGRPLDVFLGIRNWSESAGNVTVRDSLDDLASVRTRLVTGTPPDRVADLHAGGGAQPVERLTHVLKILWESELAQSGDYQLIPLARLERVGAEIRFSQEFVPPCLSFTASETLRRLVTEIRDQVTARAHQLEEHKTRRGIHSAEFGSRDMVYFLALRSVNRYLPLLFHYTQTKPLHPWHIYGVLRQLIGELAAFSERVGVLGEDAEARKLLPEYDHRDLWRCFSAARTLIARLLDEITAGPEYVIGLPHDGTFYQAELKPSVFDGRNRFYLAVTSEQDPRAVLRALEDIAKLSSPDQLELLVARSLPGIGLQYLQIPPQELPRRKNTQYFAIDHHDDQWSAVARKQTLALHWSGAPEDVEIELMVIGR